MKLPVDAVWVKIDYRGFLFLMGLISSTSTQLNVFLAATSKFVNDICIFDRSTLACIWPDEYGGVSGNLVLLVFMFYNSAS